MGQKNTLVGRLEIQSDGVGGSAGYENLGPAGSATLTSTTASSDEMRRDIGFKTYTAGKTDVEITAECGWDDADTVLASVFTAHQNKEIVGVKFLEDTTGEGFEADMIPFGWEHSQPDDGTQTVNITFKPAYDATAPTWV